MFATLVIGLREGLEAALIVGIIAAFLRKNGKSLVGMWVGVALAVALSIAVGVGLDLVERALPQAAQEGMEAVIGAVAIFFVTGMIVWMNTHARGMKRELETQAAEALGRTGAWALACMAFLAVLREGFETAVFMLATLSAAQSATLAAAGAVIGVLIAVGIGWGIYAGGVKINLSRFFRFTGAFLILVAAGLAITVLRTAHEAGWLNAGQQTTVSLAWLVAPGSVQSALITGVLGIPADPRLIELFGWLAYLVPVSLFVYWPASHRLSRHGAMRLQVTLAAVLVAAAGALAAALPVPYPQVPATAPLVATPAVGAHPVGAHPAGTLQLATHADGSPAALIVHADGTAPVSLPLAGSAARREPHLGIDASGWSLSATATPAGAPATLTLDQVTALAGGRVPVGLNPRQHPGPFTADWSTQRDTIVWVADGALLDARQRSTTIVSLSGSGLQTPRALNVGSGSAAPTGDWQVAPDYTDTVVAALDAAAAARDARRFWAVQLPAALCLSALLLGAAAWRNRRQSRPFRPVVSGSSSLS